MVVGVEVMLDLLKISSVWWNKFGCCNRGGESMWKACSSGQRLVHYTLAIL